MDCYEYLKDVQNISVEVYRIILSPLVSPPGAEGEVEPAAGRHLQRRRGMCPIYLQTRVDVLLLQRIQAQHPLHDPLRRCGVCSSSGEAEHILHIRIHVHVKDTIFNYLLLFAVNHELGKE